MKEFHDNNGICEHDIFQQWRKENPLGFFINIKSPNNLMIHKVDCRHSGDPDWEAGRNNWGNLTKSKKVCSANETELEKWVVDQGLSLKKCRDCM